VSKEDVFLDESISLTDKRKYMKVVQQMKDLVDRSEESDQAHVSTSVKWVDWLESFSLSPAQRDLILYGIGRLSGEDEVKTCEAPSLLQRVFLLIDGLLVCRHA
jgi:RAB protein geranylgeranyltransferase component A